MWTVDFTREELVALEIQISGRITALKILQEEAAQRKDVPRVIELENAMQPIISGRDKILRAAFKKGSRGGAE